MKLFTITIHISFIQTMEEAIEDLYGLSQSDVLFGQTNSHYSTLAALLVRVSCVYSVICYNSTNLKRKRENSNIIIHLLLLMCRFF